MNTLDLIQNSEQELREYVEATNDTEFSDDDMMAIIKSSREAGEGPLTGDQIIEEIQSMSNSF